jgi:hypothetical protein
MNSGAPNFCVGETRSEKEAGVASNTALDFDFFL